MASAAEASDGPGRNGRRGVQARFRKLKPRPGQASPKVAEHQRARIHAATIELVDECGYHGLTVTGIARAAGISNGTFYENFTDKEDCFLATYELIVRHTAREVLTARNAARGWRAKLRAGFLAFAREVAENPKPARLALIEAFEAGGALARMEHTNGLFEALVADSFTLDDDSMELPPLIVKGIVAGTIRVARARLLAGEARRLAEDADELMSWALSLRSAAAREACPGSVHPVPGPAGQPLRIDNGRAARVGRELPGDERAMILSAAVQLAATEGYEELTVPRIRTAAGLSRRRFEAYFDGVDDCFLAALELLAARLLAGAKAAYHSADDWPTGVHRACANFCREIAEDPLLVRLAFFELLAPGQEAIAWRVNLIGNLSSLLRCTAPAATRPTKLAAEASTGAVWAILHHYATTGRAQQIPRVTGTVSYLVLAPAIGAERAVEAIRAEQEERTAAVAAS